MIYKVSQYTRLLWILLKHDRYVEALQIGYLPEDEAKP